MVVAGASTESARSGEDVLEGAGVVDGDAGKVVEAGSTDDDALVEDAASESTSSGIVVVANSEDVEVVLELWAEVVVGSANSGTSDDDVVVTAGAADLEVVVGLAMLEDVLLTAGATRFSRLDDDVGTVDVVDTVDAVDGVVVNPEGAEEVVATWTSAELVASPADTDDIVVDTTSSAKTEEVVIPTAERELVVADAMEAEEVVSVKTELVVLDAGRVLVEEAAELLSMLESPIMTASRVSGTASPGS